MIHLFPFIWINIIALELALYILLDGANLGIGFLSLIPQKEADRSLFLHTLGPTWNANETWLVVAAGSLFAAFPTVFGVTFNALYIPGVILLVGILLRSVSFEFYDYAVRKKIWSKAFGIGSLLTIIGQGFLIGGLMNGITLDHMQFAGGPFDWATPFTFLFTLGVLCSYAVLGDAALIHKTGKEFTHERFRRVLLLLLITLVTFLGAAYFLPSDIQTLFVSQWTLWPTNIILPTVVVLTIATALALIYQTYKRAKTKYVYPLTLLLISLGLIGVISGIFPYIIPPSVPYWQVASPDSTLIFMLWGIGPILPIVFLYNWHLGFIFRHQSGKVGQIASYNDALPVRKKTVRRTSKRSGTQ